MIRNLKRDYFWNTLGVFFQNALSPLLLVIVTRVNGIYDSGVFSFAFSVAIIFWALGMWGGRTYQVSDAKKVFYQQSYITVRLILALVMLVGVVAFCIVNNYDIAKASIIIALVLLKVFESIADSIYGVMQVNNSLFVAGKSLIYKSVFGLVTFTLIDITTHDLFLSSLGLVTVNIIGILIYDIPQTKKLQSIRLKGELFSKYIQQALEIMKLCLPLFLISFLSAFSLNIPRYFIDIYHQSQLGYFGILAMPITLIVLLMTFILQPNIVSLSQQLNKKEYIAFNSIVSKILRLTSIVGLIVLALAYLVGVQVLTLVFGVDFSEYKPILVVLTLGAIASAIVAIYINMLTIMRHFKVQAYVLLITNIILAVLCVLFIQDYGLIGGVSIFTVINFIQAILFSQVYRHYIRKLQDAKKA